MKWCLQCLHRFDRNHIRCEPPLHRTPICSACMALNGAHALVALASSVGWSVRQLIADLDKHWIGAAR